MILMEYSMLNFIGDIASSSPAPGGGTVAAVTGAFAAGLGGMVCGLTIGNDKYPEAQNILPSVKATLDGARKRMAELADEDAAAFGGMVAAFKLPKDTIEEKAARSAAICAASLEATKVPLETAFRAVVIAEALVQTARYGNENTLSDCGTAIECARAAAEGAFMNVDINLPGVKNEDIINGLRQKRNELKKKADIFYGGAMEILKIKRGGCSGE